MIKVAVVEDEPKAADLLASYLDRYAASPTGLRTKTNFAVTRFSDGVSFLAAARMDFDLVFMDIEMPDLDGMETAKRLRAINPFVTLVFVTNMAQYAVNGYEVRALDFLVKPVSYPNFETKLRRAVEQIRLNENEKVMINGTKGVVTVPKSDIVYVEIMGHDLMYHTTSCGDVQAYGTLKKTAEMLGDGFACPHSSYLVNLACVRSVQDYTVTAGNHELPVSHLRKKEFMRTLADYFGGKI